MTVSNKVKFSNGALDNKAAGRRNEVLPNISRTGRVIETAVAQRKIVPFKKCYSGLLGNDPLYRYMALATGPAFAAFDGHTPLKEALQSDLAASGQLNFRHFEEKWPPAFRYFRYQHNRTFGIHLLDSQREQDDYDEAEKALESSFKGIHRRLFLGMLGVAAPAEVDDLKSHLYSAMIRRIATIGRDPSVSKTRAVRLADAPFDQIETAEDGSQTIVFSMGQLEQERDMFTLEVETVTESSSWILSFWKRIRSFFRR